MKSTYLFLLGLLAASQAGAHGEHEQTSALTAAAPVSAAAQTDTLVRSLNLPSASAARLKQAVVAYLLQRDALLARHSAAGEAERARIESQLQQLAERQRAAVAAILTPAQAQAFFALLEAQGAVAPTARARASRWLVNASGERSKHIFEKDSNQGVLVNVQSVEKTTLDKQDYQQVKATGIPNYRVMITPEILDTLKKRPKAATDFIGGKPNVALGDVVEFGQNIGYNSSPRNCSTTGGNGYWPPGPECPQNVSKQASFPLQPTPATEVCYTGLGPAGLMLNGTSVFNWNDGQSNKNEGVWHNTAANAEVHDLDLCSGHAANNNYHHHNWSACQASQFGDQGQHHSPVYGYAADGYPIHGPWFSKGVLAKSAWVKRDYDHAQSASGCGEAGARSCLLNDPYDLSKGKTATSKPGPATNTTFISQSGNPIPAVSGLFFEDYYYDPARSARKGANLDQDNGHEHDGLGYHYHLSMERDQTGKLVPAFPFTIGPRYHGKLPSNASATCNSSATALPGGPGGQPPGGQPPGGQPPGG